MHVAPSFDPFLSASADVLEATGHERLKLFVDYLRNPGALSARVSPGPMQLADSFASALNEQEVAEKDRGLQRAISIIWPHFNWRTADALQTPEPFRSSHSMVEVIGPDGHYKTPNLRFGLFVIAPNTPYPSHLHEAEEFYYVFSGHADWQQDEDAYVPRPPGTLIHNKPFQPHGTTTHSEMVIVLWGWRGDIRYEQYRFV